jgi:hypothetical protein
VDPNGDGAGFCMLSCMLDSTCRTPDYTCYNVDEQQGAECGPYGSGTAAPGDGCATHQDCNGGQLSFCGTEAVDGFPGGYCFINCNAQAPCPQGSHCGQLDSSAKGLCMPDCTTNSCRLGYWCGDIDGDIISECY